MIDYTLPLDELPDPLPIEPLTKPFDVTITPPGSKSITCRAYVLAALAEGESKIIRPLRADDTDRLLDALCTLGAEARWEGDDVHIKGVAGRFPRGGSVNLGDGGTPARFMIAVACLAAEPVVVDGAKRMRERPIAEGVEMLRQLGATIEYVEEEGRLPVRVTSTSLQGGELNLLRLKSSQFVSALMLIASSMQSKLEITFADQVTSSSYIELTAQVLRDWEIRSLPADGRTLENWGEYRIDPCIINARSDAVDTDASSAAYWWIAAAISNGCRVRIPGLATPYQADLNVHHMLSECGVKRHEDTDDYSFTVEHSDEIRLPTDKIDLADLPDGAVALSIFFSCCDQKVTLDGLHTLRVKETDRLAALEAELTKIGCTVSTTEDSITIDPSTRHDDPVIIETYNDHRMAMAFGVLGLARPGLSIRNPACVAKSYPGFWKDFAKLYQ